MKYIDLKGEVVDSGGEWIYDWYGIQAVSPKMVQNKLNNANGDDVTIRINSGGGSVFAGFEIYNMLKAYEGKVIIEIQGLCASIAGVIAMAGYVKMSPLSQFMIHNISGNANGDYRDMEHTADVLKQLNSSLANAFKLKTGMSDEKVQELMDNESWFTANQCLEMKIADEIMYSDEKVDSTMLNMLKDNAINMCNSINIKDSFVNKMKKFKPLNIQPVRNNKVDFFMQQKAKAQLELLNLGKKVI